MPIFSCSYGQVVRDGVDGLTYCAVEVSLLAAVSITALVVLLALSIITLVKLQRQAYY